ncbi:hypothetical protein ACFL0M_10240 [Thermodesulfobacteriota bacterium]
MKKLCWGFIKVGTLIFIILSSGFAVYKLVMLLSAAGLGLSSTSFVNGSASLAKNTIKYLKRVPDLANRGILKKFLSGKISRQNSKKIWSLLKKTAGPYQGPSVAYQTLTI